MLASNDIRRLRLQRFPHKTGASFASSRINRLTELMDARDISHFMPLSLGLLQRRADDAFARFCADEGAAFILGRQLTRNISQVLVDADERCRHFDYFCPTCLRVGLLRRGAKPTAEEVVRCFKRHDPSVSLFSDVFGTGVSGQRLSQLRAERWDDVDVVRSHLDAINGYFGIQETFARRRLTTALRRNLGACSEKGAEPMTD